MTNKENIRLWVDALRSGEYEQGHGSLRPDENAYCCLGVACEVAIKNGIKLDPFHDGFMDPDMPGSYYSGAMPQKVVEWLGLTDDEREDCGDLELPEFPDDPDFDGHQLAAWNDEYRKSFNQIADIIERNLLS